MAKAIKKVNQLSRKYQSLATSILPSNSRRISSCDRNNRWKHFSTHSHYWSNLLLLDLVHSYDYKYFDPSWYVAVEFINNRWQQHSNQENNSTLYNFSFLVLHFRANIRQWLNIWWWSEIRSNFVMEFIHRIFHMASDFWIQLE